MPDKVQVADLYKDRSVLPQIQTTARPVDTFINPGHPVSTDGQLQEVVKAFQEIQPGLSRFVDRRVDQVNEEDLIAGHKAAMANKTQFKEAVTKGLLPAGASPWFQVGWERQKAEVASTDFDRELREAYAVSGLSEQNDPTKFNGWVADFTSNWQTMHPEHQDNPEFPKIFNAMASRSQDNLANYHAAERTKKIESDVIQNTSLQLSQELDYPSDNQPKNLGAILSRQIANGLDGQLANKLVAQAVVRKAIEDEDLYGLDMLQDIPSGSGVVGQIGFVKDMVQEARDKISAAKARGEHISYLETKANKTGTVKANLGSAFAKIAKDPRNDTSAEFAAIVAIDPDQADKIYSFRNLAIASETNLNKVIESNPLKADILLRTLRGQMTSEAIVEEVHAGAIDYETAKDLITNVLPKATEHKAVVSDPIVSQFEKTIVSVITKNELSDNRADQRAYRASEANAALLKGMIQFKDLNPKANQLDVLKHARDLTKELLEIYREPDAEPLPTVVNDVRLFNDLEALETARAEYNYTNGKSGVIKNIMDRFGFTSKEVIDGQHALLRDAQKAQEQAVSNEPQPQPQLSDSAAAAVRTMSSISNYGMLAPPAFNALLAHDHGGPAIAHKPNEMLKAGVSPEEMKAWLDVLQNPKLGNYKESIRRLQTWDTGHELDGRENKALIDRAASIRLALQALRKQK